MLLEKGYSEDDIKALYKIQWDEWQSQLQASQIPSYTPIIPKTIVGAATTDVLPSANPVSGNGVPGVPVVFLQTLDEIAARIDELEKRGTLPELPGLLKSVDELKTKLQNLEELGFENQSQISTLQQELKVVKELPYEDFYNEFKQQFITPGTELNQYLQEIIKPQTPFIQPEIELQPDVELVYFNGQMNDTKLTSSCQ